jgi:hypothetical protein
MRTVAQALAVAREEHSRPSEDWTGYCQMFCRTVYGIEPGFGTAYKQWLGTPDRLRFPGGHPSQAPVGSLLCYKGSSAAGHIMLAAPPFRNGVTAAWSNDLVTWGKIDKVSRTAPITAWRQDYLGYILSINGHEIVLPTKREKDWLDMASEADVKKWLIEVLTQEPLVRVPPNDDNAFRGDPNKVSITDALTRDWRIGKDDLTKD